MVGWVEIFRASIASRPFEKKIVIKGRLGPGEIIGVRIEKGKVYKNNEIKNYLSKDFKKFNNQIIDLDKKFSIGNK